MDEVRSKIRAALFDGDRKSRETLISFLRQHFTDIEIIGEASSLNSAEKILQDSGPDLVFTEAIFGQDNLFDMLNKIDEGHFRTIFMTSSDRYALQALQMQAVGYLIKPVQPDELARAVNKALEEIRKDELLENFVRTMESNQSPQQSKKITLKTSESIYVIAIEDISCCESDRSYSRFHLADGQMIMVSKPLKEFEELLCENSFVRTHKSFLVNFDHIERFDRTRGGYVVLKNGKEIPVASRKKNELFNRFRLISP